MFLILLLKTFHLCHARLCPQTSGHKKKWARFRKPTYGLHPISTIPTVASNYLHIAGRDDTISCSGQPAGCTVGNSGLAGRNQHSHGPRQRVPAPTLAVQSLLLHVNLFSKITSKIIINYASARPYIQSCPRQTHRRAKR